MPLCTNFSVTRIVWGNELLGVVPSGSAFKGSFNYSTFYGASACVLTVRNYFLKVCVFFICIQSKFIFEGVRLCVEKLNICVYRQIGCLSVVTRVRRCIWSRTGSLSSSRWVFFLGINLWHSLLMLASKNLRLNPVWIRVLTLSKSVSNRVLICVLRPIWSAS